MRGLLTWSTVFSFFFSFFLSVRKDTFTRISRRIFIDRNSFMPRDRIKRIKLIYNSEHVVDTFVDERSYTLFLFYPSFWKAPERGSRDSRYCEIKLISALRQLWSNYRYSSSRDVSRCVKEIKYLYFPIYVHQCSTI